MVIPKKNENTLSYRTLATHVCVYDSMFKTKKTLFVQVNAVYKIYRTRVHASIMHCLKAFPI